METESKIECSAATLIAAARALEDLRATVVVPGSDGVARNKRELLTLAVQTYPDNAQAYTELALCLPQNGSVVLNASSGESVDVKGLYIKSLSLDIRNAVALNNVSCLLLDDTICIGAKEYSKRDLLILALDVDPEHVAAYNNLGTLLPKGDAEEAAVTLLNGETLTKPQLFQRAIVLDPHGSVAYNNLGRCLPPNSHIRVNGERISKRDLFLRSIELSKPGESGEAYHNLALCMQSDETTSIGGRVYGKKALLLKSIALSPGFAKAYNNLAHEMDNTHTVRIDGNEISKQGVLVMSIEKNPKYALAYQNLASSMPDGAQSVTLLGKHMTQVDLYCEALTLNPSLYTAYLQLSVLLHAKHQDRSVEIAGTTHTSITLLVEAARRCPTRGDALHFLALVLPPQGTVAVHTDELMGKEALLREAVLLDPVMPETYLQLALVLPDTAEVPAFDSDKGTIVTMTKLALYKKVLSVQPRNVDALAELHRLQPKEGLMALDDGRRLSKSDLYEELQRAKRKRSSLIRNPPAPPQKRVMVSTTKRNSKEKKSGCACA